MDDYQYPLSDIIAARNNTRLQKKHPISEGQTNYLRWAKPCPGCQTLPAALAWVYFESPPVTWQWECGRAGWMTFCDKCNRQVDYFGEALS